MLRILMMMDSKHTQLSEQSIIKLSKILFGYLIEIAACFPGEDDECTISNSILGCRYYLLPCLVLFDRSTKLLKLVLDMLQSLAINFDPMPTSHYYSQIVNDHSRKIMAVASVILMISKDVKVQKVLSSCKAEIKQHFTKYTLSSEKCSAH
ncbi:hypothetical protein Nepgr_011532 [Nepenthes gracilis]|uniref:Uncharacterized protein n=1 Tax=Nepenthes gracilis TaxID=150966 RepID=A0AAD3XMH0_NEPGR|nr:hypothetical protein Nepgr_011532 [Nepenthes gracilis]